LDNSEKIILDLYCCAGGCSDGYRRAGFKPYGIDIKKQPHYPFPFLQIDAIEALDGLIQGDSLIFSNFDTLSLIDISAIHASPPCQFGSMATQQWRSAGREYKNYIPDTRDRLIKSGLPYVIENVVGEPYLKNPLKLNASYFHIRIRRTRYFETSFPMNLVLLPKEEPSHSKMGRPVTENSIITPVGHFSGCAIAKKRMGIDWKIDQGELAQAIPPVYTEFIGKHLLKAIADIEKGKE
jgi:DNA (cytosine-5)-methyltransferase 1